MDPMSYTPIPLRSRFGVGFEVPKHLLRGKSGALRVCEQFWGIYFFITFGLGNHLQHGAIFQTFWAPQLEVAKLTLEQVTKHNTTKTVTRFKNLVVEDSGQNNRNKPRWWFHIFFMYTPYIWGEMISQFWRAYYFSGGLKPNQQPPTSKANQTKTASLKSGLHCEEACHHGEVAFVTCRSCRRVESSNPGRAGWRDLRNGEFGSYGQKYTYK